MLPTLGVQNRDSQSCEKACKKTKRLTAVCTSTKGWTAVPSRAHGISEGPEPADLIPRFAHSAKLL